MRKKSEQTLYVGLDESNHGRYPEIIVAISSLIPEDASISKMQVRNRMSEEEIIKFLSNEQRNYVYIAARERELDTSNPIVEAAPYLVDKLVREAQKKNNNIDSIVIKLDGELRREDITQLSENLFDLRAIRKISSADIHAYPKSKVVMYDYPTILIAADTLANLLFRKHSFTERINAEDRRIELRR
jgi:hypothetical protein